MLMTIRGSVMTLRLGMSPPLEILERLQGLLGWQALVFMANAVFLTWLVSVNLTRPLKEMVRVMREVRGGIFEGKVKVTTNDEIGYAGDSVNEMVEGLKERDFIKETFGKYVTQEVRDEILKGRIPLDGEQKEVTVLFADLRDFTPLTEATPPKEVIKIINGYFAEMAQAITRHQGLVLQYIGDEIEAVFGAPLPVANHPDQALRAALEMRRRLEIYNQKLKAAGKEPLRHGIGIHTGYVVAANIGSPDRLSYAMVGDAVNLASRIQEMNKRFETDIILSGAAKSRLAEQYPLQGLPQTLVKGMSQPVEIFAAL
jgi:adenylate cyclase